jgi:hypothetical protein
MVQQGNWQKLSFVTRVVGAFALGFCLGAGAQAQQDQPAQQQDQQQNQQQPQGQAPDQQPQVQPPVQPQDQQQAPPQNGPKYYPQDADQPPYSNDHPAQGAPGRQAPPPWEYSPDQDVPPNGAPSAKGHYQTQNRNDNAGRPRAPLPSSLTIPAGTVLQVRVNELLSSDHNQVGDRFTAELQRPIVVSGWVVARRGQTVTGQVEAAVKAGRVKGTSQLGLELTDLSMVDGQSKPILTELWKGSGGTSHGADAATIGGTTAAGAAIGAAADWGTGAAIGAGAGAAAGIAAVLLTRGRPTVIEPETMLSFRLVDPVTVDTTQSAQAFAPVSQQDYDNGGRGPGRRRATGYPGPYYYGPGYDCGYSAPCYAYPYPAYYGYYPGYWWGPTVFVGGGFHRGFRR